MTHLDGCRHEEELLLQPQFFAVFRGIIGVPMHAHTFRNHHLIHLMTESRQLTAAKLGGNKRNAKVGACRRGVRTALPRCPLPGSSPPQPAIMQSAKRLNTAHWEQKLGSRRTAVAWHPCISANRVQTDNAMLPLFCSISSIAAKHAAKQHTVKRDRCNSLGVLGSAMCLSRCASSFDNKYGLRKDGWADRSTSHAGGNFVNRRRREESTFPNSPLLNSSRSSSDSGRASNNRRLPTVFVSKPGMGLS